jgi:hypothetical protein
MLVGHTHSQESDTEARRKRYLTMCDLMMQPSLSSTIVDFPDLHVLLIIVFVGIMGLSTGLIVIETISHYWFRDKTR